MTVPAAPPALPLRTLRWSLAALWLWTAVVSWLNADGISIALLDGLPARWQAVKPALIHAGAALDLLIGVALLWRPGRAVYAIALAGMAAMTVAATCVNPAWWLHPFGPLAKNLPLAAALWLLWRCDTPRDNAAAPR